jgi:hypothetical protein
VPTAVPTAAHRPPDGGDAALCGNGVSRTAHRRASQPTGSPAANAIAVIVSAVIGE